MSAPESQFILHVLRFSVHYVCMILWMPTALKCVLLPRQLC